MTNRPRSPSPQPHKHAQTAPPGPVNALIRRLNACTSSERVVSEAVAGIAELLCVDCVFVMEREGERLELREHYPCGNPLDSEAFANHRLQECLCGIAAAQGRPVYSPDITHDSRCTRCECTTAGFTSFAALPLMFRNELFGLVGIGCARRRDFAADAELLDTLAQVISLSIKNARYLESAQREASSRREAQQEAKRTQEMYRSIVQSSPAGMHFYELLDNDRLVFSGANPAADTILGVKNVLFVGKSIEEAFPALSDTEVPTRYREVARTGKSWSAEQITYNENGIAGAFSVLAFQTAPGRVAVEFCDITGRKQTELRLRLFEKCVESSTDAVGMSTPQGAHIYQNKAFDNLFGTIGSDPPATLYADQSVGRNVFSTIMQGRNWEGEVVLRAADATLRDVFLRAWAIRDDTQEIIGLAGIHTDITERRRLIEAAQTNQKLESLGILAGGIAHDFNNLLSGVYGFVDLARRGLGRSEGSEESGRFLDEALGSLDRARALTLQLLTFASGGIPIMKSGQLFPFVQETVTFALSGSKVTAVFEVPPDLWPCRFDKNQFAQVVDNLAINARQAMPLGGTLCVKAANVTLHPDAHPPLAAGHFVVLSVIDSGIGIAPETLPHIFDPFFTTKSQGHGLGLATSYSIVNKHGGAIEVASQPGAGARFDVYLPAADAAHAPAQRSTAASHTGRGTVLIMDDEPVLREVLSRMLANLGYHCVTATNGEEALAAFRAQRRKKSPFAALFFDLTIRGGMGGKEAVQQVRALDADVPVFVASGYAADPILADPAAYGFTDGIPKPFKLDELVSLLNRWIPPGEP